jgi:hypothetical protein
MRAGLIARSLSGDYHRRQATLSFTAGWSRIVLDRMVLFATMLLEIETPKLTFARITGGRRRGKRPRKRWIKSRKCGEEK